MAQVMKRLSNRNDATAKLARRRKHFNVQRRGLSAEMIMTNTPAQGAAFPIEGYSNGISIRDYFAAKAMQGLSSNPETWSNHDDKLAEMAYQAADAMLRAREAS